MPVGLIAYLFDCIDGYMARRYKQTSVFGDYYDHISDKVKQILLLIVFLYKYPIRKLIPTGFVLGGLLFAQWIYQGCAQKIKANTQKEKRGEILDLLQILCPNEETTIQWIKYFSCGTFILALTLAAVWLELSQTKKK